MSELAVARRLTEIEPIFWNNMVIDGQPGFQTCPKIGANACLDEVARLMREIGIRQFEFDETFEGSSESKYGRHIDTPQAEKDNTGLAAHESLDGLEGLVVLEQARFGAKNNHIDLVVQVGPRFTGELRPGMMTFFSEGINVENTALRGVALGITRIRMGPAIHEFTTIGSGKRYWRRYTHKKPAL